ncbi:hypothetical protein [Rariglobus hedericola]|uniref:DUF4397 domain-containing protein n=1 Tax=Rariglobus hedericola TaxID=2597822 RepID=A0A556QS58_9BACT|nr:hypothetical protein [Rariglobus hedericola]TSJ79471.1 hypothetical protein FPL22_09340 [Rariglobus hedericola]
MNRSPYRILSLILATLTLWSGPVFSAEKEPAPVITVRFKALSVSGALPEGLDIVISPKQRLHLNVPSTYIESAVKYTGPADISFIKPEGKPRENKPAAGTPNALTEPQVLATTSIAPPGGDYLLLFAGTPDTKLKVMAIPFSAADAPLGSCLVWNLTSRALGVSLGGQRELINPQSRQLFKPTMLSQDYVDLRVVDEYQAKPRLLAGGPHFLPAHTRQLFFIVERTPGEAPVLVKVVSELPESLAKLESAPRR